MLKLQILLIKLKNLHKKSRISLVNYYIHSKSVISYEFKKYNALLDKPISMGFMIFEISKFQRFIHLDTLKEIFGDNMIFLYTGTDSFKLLIKNCDPYEF